MRFLKNVVFSGHTWIHSGKNKELHPSIIRLQRKKEESEANVCRSHGKLRCLSTAFQQTGCDVKRARGARQRVDLLNLIPRNDSIWRAAIMKNTALADSC